MSLSDLAYWFFKLYFSFLFVIYFYTKLIGLEGGIMWDITGVFSLIFFLVNIRWRIKNG